MIDKIIGALLGFAVCKVLGLLGEGGSGLANLFHASYTSPPVPHPSGHGYVQPPGITPALPSSGLQVTSTAAPFNTDVPAGLPPFPSGWRPARTTQDIVARAQVLLTTLPLGGSKIEQATDGRWIRYVKTKMGTKTGVVAWEPKTPVSSVQTSPIPGVPNMTPAVYTTPGTSSSSGRILKRGMSGPDVAAWQAKIGITPADGIFGANTEHLTKVWQASHGLKPDGKVGPESQAAAGGGSAIPTGVTV